MCTALSTHEQINMENSVSPIFHFSYLFQVLFKTVSLILFFASHVTAWHNKHALPGWLHYLADAHRFRIGYLYASIAPHHLPNPIIHGFKKCRVWCKDQSLTFRGHQSVWHPQRTSLYIHCSHQANGPGHVTVLHSIMKRLCGGVGGCLKALRHRWLFPIFGSECWSVLGCGITVVPAPLCYTHILAHAQTHIHTDTRMHMYVH